MRFTVHHVAISVHDMPESIGFYRVFGFEPVVHHREPDGSMEIAHLRLAGVFLEIFWFARHVDPPGAAAELSTDLPRIGVKHLALQVDSVEEAARFVEDRGLAGNVTVQRGKTGIRYFFITDPSGNFVEIVEDRRRLHPLTR